MVFITGNIAKRSEGHIVMISDFSMKAVAFSEWILGFVSDCLLGIISGWMLGINSDLLVVVGSD